MRTTLTLDDHLAARLEELARTSRRSFKDVVNEVIQRGLDAKPAEARPFVVRARDLGLRPGLQLDDVSELLEQLDGPAFK